MGVCVISRILWAFGMRYAGEKKACIAGATQASGTSDN
jgi:hypothetical protein